MKLEGNNVTGVVHSVNYQRPDVMLQKSTFDSATGTIHMEAEAPNPRGGAAVHYVIDGEVMNGTMSGSWNHGASKGDFKLMKK